MNALPQDLQLIESAGDPLALDAAEKQAAEQTVQAAHVIVVAAEAGDVGAPFEPEALKTLRALQVGNRAEWMRLRNRLKLTSVGVTELDKQLRGDIGGEQDDENVADKLVSLARGRCDFVHDANGEPYAVFEAAGARQVLHLDSKAFGEYLSHAFYTEHDRAPSELALRVALTTLKGQAKFDGSQREVFVRIAKTESGYWLDLCNDAWECVRIVPAGWKVMAGGEVPLFTRSASMRPLPVPARGGSLDELWPLVNIPEPDRMMVLAWLLECLRADTPHVVLELVGEQGSIKSTTQKNLRRLIDPNQANLRAAPKTVEDVWIGARNSHMVSFENLSHLSADYQNALCVLTTGGGHATRTLYTNGEEFIIDVRKPIVLNGISVIVTAQDLLDRCLHFDLPTIKNRKLETDIESQFEAAQPKLLGALLDQFVKVLAMLPSVVIAADKLPRMADFAVLGEAVFRVSGEEAGEFLARYNGMRADGVHRTIDSSPVGAALLAFLSERPSGWTGALTPLLEGLERHRPHGESSWPRSAKGLGDALRRLAPSLRMIGYECASLPKTGGVIEWVIGFCGEKLLKQSPASPGSPGRSHEQSIETGHAGHAGHDSESFAPEKRKVPAVKVDSGRLVEGTL
ncbi:MAG: hypothetical protein HY661_07405 [Betaproteobacteria bacterium]|nr:hypothetical protein [Betaproteobacteria bacterium]